MFFFSKSRVTKPKADSEAVQLKIPKLRGVQVRGNDKLESWSFKGFRLKRHPECVLQKHKERRLSNLISGALSVIEEIFWP